MFMDYILQECFNKLRTEEIVERIDSSNYFQIQKFFGENKVGMLMFVINNVLQSLAEFGRKRFLNKLTRLRQLCLFFFCSAFLDKEKETAYTEKGEIK